MKNIFSKASIANSVTSLNIFCGFVSIVYSADHNFKMAAIFIIIAAIFDTLDGIVARLLGTSSRFGVELDSLSDVVSFGAAPSFLIYQSFAFKFGVWGIILSSVLLVFGALRLARFNLSVEDLNNKGDFKGLPIPVQAITISLSIISFYNGKEFSSPFSLFIVPLILLLAFLMVSNIRYNALPNLRERNLKQKLFLILTLIIALVLTIITDGVIVFYIFMGIVLFGVFRHLYYMIANNKNNE